MNTKLRLLGSLLALSVVFLSGCLNEGSKKKDHEATVNSEDHEVQAATMDWREDYAYSMGIAAMHYTYPFWRMAHVRYDWTQKQLPESLRDVVPNDLLNQFWHGRVLTTSDWQDGGGPNNDTLYSTAWIYVKDEPMILSIPKIDRYYTFQFSGADSDNYAYVSELKHGRKEGHYAILPKGWKGTLPEGVVSVGEASTPWGMIAGRTYVAGESDLSAVHRLQDQYKLTSLSQWGKANPERAQPEVFKPYDKAWHTIDEEEPLAVWRTINRMMTENPPVAHESSAIGLFKDINIGPGLDVDALDEASKRGLARAALDGFAQIKAAKVAGAGAGFIKNNGWMYSLDVGHPGAANLFMLRSVHQSYGGLVGNDLAEAQYYAGFYDANGDVFDGKKRYRIVLPVGREPDVGAFWSVTLYDDKANLVANDMNRYSVGDRTAGLVRAEDDSLIIAIQNERPTEGDVNWLPAPKGHFWFLLRAYQPGESIIDGSWQPPKVEPID